MEIRHHQNDNHNNVEEDTPSSLVLDASSTVSTLDSSPSTLSLLSGHTNTSTTRRSYPVSSFASVTGTSFNRHSSYRGCSSRFLSSSHILGGTTTSSSYYDDHQQHGGGDILLPANHGVSKRKSEEVLTMSKLRFSSLSMVGREEQQQKLQACLERVIVTANEAGALAAVDDIATVQEQEEHHPEKEEEKEEEEQPQQEKAIDNHHRQQQQQLSNSRLRGRREVVFISGEAGTGKTTLAQTLLESGRAIKTKTKKSGTGTHCRHGGGVYVRGKFDKNNEEPYMGIATAMKEVCGHILMLRDRSNRKRGGGGTTTTTTTTTATDDMIDESPSSSHCGSSHAESTTSSIIDDNNNNNSNTAASITSSSSSSSSSFERIRHELLKNLGSEIHLLMNLIPDLSEIFVGSDLITDGVVNKNGSSNSNGNDGCGGDNGGTKSTTNKSIHAFDDINTKQTSYEAKARFQYAFRTFIRVIATEFSPLVLVLDDLQWIDSASLSLLRVLMESDDFSHTKSPISLMIVGTYRSDEVVDDDSTSGSDDSFSRLRRDLREKQNNTSSSDDSQEDSEFGFTELSVGNLTPDQVNGILMHVLAIDESERTFQLAEICHKRSHGNPFGLLVFIETLKDEGLLEFNIGKFSWKWDHEQILSRTSPTANVVDLMRGRMEKLPAHIRQRLSVAACLGSSFSPVVAEMVFDNIRDHWKDHSDARQLQEEGKMQAEGAPASQVLEEETELRDEDCTSWLTVAEQVGILEIRGHTCRWIHDKVLEAGSNLIPESELPSLKARIGEVLFKKLDPEAMKSSIFIIVSLLNETPSGQESIQPIQLAELNLQAAKQAFGISAFESAKKYATMGVSKLPSNRWTEHYELTLALYTVAVESLGYLGNTTEIEKYYAEVTELPDRPLLDKLPVYGAMISHLEGRKSKPEEALHLLLDLLGQLGCNFPKYQMSRGIATITRLTKMKRKISILNMGDIMMKLPVMRDPVHLETMRLLDSLSSTAYMAGRSDIMALAILFLSRMTLKHGLCDYSAPAFAFLALLFHAALGDLQLASKSGKFANLLLEKNQCKNTVSRTLMVLLAYGSMCWTEPIPSLIPTLLVGYETGLSTGDTKNAMWCIWNYIVFGFQSGRPLKMVEADCITYGKQMDEFKREATHELTIMFWEAIQNLMGRRENSDTLLGETFESRYATKRGNQDPTIRAIFYSLHSYLYFVFGEYEKGAKLAIESGDSYAKVAPGHVWIMGETFARGMSLYAMARVSKKRIYRKQARKVHKTIKGWLKQGNPNVNHYVLLLNAESAALNGKLEAADGFYHAAIVSSSRIGLTHESALAYERYGDFLLVERNEKEDAKRKMVEALRRYGDWGALKKVDMLNEKYHDLWEKPDEIRLFA